MKICPQCNSKYTDETLQFCLQDGSPLEFGVPETSSMETVALNEEEAQTVIAARKSEKIRFDLEQLAHERVREETPLSNPTIQAEPRSSNTLLAVLATAFAMLVLFLGIAAAWFYFGSIQKQTAQNEQSNSTDNSQSRTGANQGNISPVESPTAQKTASPKPSTEKTPKVNPEEITKKVSSQLSSWKSLAEARNLGAYMGKYASRIDYYSKRGASRSFVKADKRKAFKTYTSIKSKFTNINIKPSKDGKSATATFDKEWDFSGPAKKTTGKVRTQLVFRKVKDNWLIVSERDLKVYYVNK